MRALFLAICLLVSGAAQTEPPTPLEFACDYLSIDCTDISPPTIIYTDLMGAMGLYGAYFPGEDFVFVDTTAPGHTVVHEVTHYMLYEAGFRISNCVSEEAARRVHHAWDGTEYNDKWRVRYGCQPDPTAAP